MDGGDREQEARPRYATLPAQAILPRTSLAHTLQHLQPGLSLSNKPTGQDKGCLSCCALQLACPNWLYEGWGLRERPKSTLAQRGQVNSSQSPT